MARTDSGGAARPEDEESPLIPPSLEHIHARPFNVTNGNEYTKDDRVWVKWPARILHVTWLTLKSNYVNVLLVFVPLGILAGLLHWGATVIFLLNFFAIVPLAALLSFATEELSAKLGQTMGGLLNATFGNAVELIVRLCTCASDVD